MEDIKNYTLEELNKFLKGYPSFYAHQVFNWIYKKRIEDFDLMTDISKQARDFLRDNFYFPKLKLLKRLISKDRTEKFLFKLNDNSKIETVLIPEGKRNTLCISTQVGCKFRCRFCLSGLDGFKRNLSVAEIINQYLEVDDYIKPSHITNIVYMGVGEPLDNFINVIKSIKILKSPYGSYFGKKKICLSTCGIIPQIKKLLSLNLEVKLSLSLHCSDSNKRSKLMPINKKYPLKELIKVAKEFANRDRFPVTFEYILIKDFNCNREEAVHLAKLIKGINCKVNIIVYNESKYFSWQAPSICDIQVFKDTLKKNKVFFTFRKSRGDDILAGCGQLRAEFKKEISQI